MSGREWSVQGWVMRGVMLVVLSVSLAACGGRDDPLPTLADPTALAGTLGVLPPEAVEETLTARAPTATLSPTATLTVTDTPPPASDTPSPTATHTATPSATSSATATRTPPPSQTIPPLSPTPTSPPPLTFRAASEPPADWITTTETWIGDEMAFIAPPDLADTPVRAFLLDNLVNLVWEAEGSQHVLSMALETDRGALAVTLIGYTVDDFPVTATSLADIDQRIRNQILRHSVRPGSYHLAEVEVTDVNVTFVFRVPVQTPAEPPSAYLPRAGEPGPDWLISTERWTPAELSLVFGQWAEASVGVDFVEGALRYSWSAVDGQHVLIVRPTAVAGDLQLDVVAYTIDGNTSSPAQLEAALHALREGILLHSIPPGPFQLARVTFGLDNLELVFLIPPQFPG